MHQIFEIVCSLYNAFGNSLYADDGKAMEADVTEMRRRRELENDVMEEEGSTTGWRGGDVEQFAELDFIPEFDLKALRKLACGPYVLSLAAKYYKHAKNVIYRYVNATLTNGLATVVNEYCIKIMI